MNEGTQKEGREGDTPWNDLMAVDESNLEAFDRDHFGLGILTSL